MRLNRFLSDSGYCSRRQADRHIEAGEVLVNGQRALLGQVIDPTRDKVSVKGQAIKPRKKKDYVTLALNKPRGITCTSDPRRRDNIIDFIDYPERIFTIGRLDRDSEGLILLTNDGSIVNRILRAENAHEKEYLVTLDKAYDKAFLDQMASGVRILGQRTKPAKLRPISKTRFRIIITQGLNRQIRRMCEVFGYKVQELRRLRIMHITLGQLPLGTWRYLTPKELRDLHQLIER